MSNNKWNTTPAGGGGSGDVTGPASSTDNAATRFDGNGGKTLQNSGVIIDDSDNVTGVTSLDVDGSSGATLSVNTSDLYVNSTTKDIGLGTASPDQGTNGYTRTTTASGGSGNTNHFIEIHNAAPGATENLGGFGWTANTTPVTQILGRTDGATNNGLLRFRTASGGSMADAMEIDSSGDIGVGVNSPDGKVHIKNSNDHIVFEETGGTANETKWVMKAESDQLQIGVPANDAYSAFGSPVILADRTANVVDNVTIQGTNVKTSKGTFRFNQSTWNFEMATGTSFLNSQDYYHKINVAESFTCRGVQVYVTVIGVDPTNMDAALYNSSGTVVASMTSTDLVGALGVMTLEFDSTVDLTADTDYWVGIGGDASNSQFLSTTSSFSNIDWNRFASNATTQDPLPAGTTTSSRYCIRLVE